MIDTAQALLIAVITTLTIILAVIGIQFILILREFKKMVEKINLMLGDARVITKSVSGSVGEVSGLVSGFSTIFKIFSLFRKKEKKKEGKENG